MDHYKDASYAASKVVTNMYSTSFGLSIKLFEASLRPHIYAIYGLVRVADEIVDTYTGTDKAMLLRNLENETTQSLKTGYSTNPIVHAFITTAREFGIGISLISPFFESMRIDLTPKKFNQKLYETYIHGSAEVIGLMCLKVFTNDAKLYKKLESGAKHLGAAYQKINFLRDIASDAETLGRWYFPFSSYELFDEPAKTAIIADIEKDLAHTATAIELLPKSSRKAVELSYQYYGQLLSQAKDCPASLLKQKRIRVHDLRKTALFIAGSIGKMRA